MKTQPRPLAVLALLLFLFAFTPGLVRAADHADGPSAANNASADLADVFFFLDPNDNSRAVVEMTMRGFIVPGEAANMGIFDPELTYQFGLEETGDAAPQGHVHTPACGSFRKQSGSTGLSELWGSGCDCFAF